jgi:hypothetical protein
MAPDTGLPDCGPGTSAKPGTIWTVPGVEGMCVLMSRPHMRDGVCYYYALPVYPATSAVAAHSALDILIDEGDSTLRIPLLGAFWNTRPLPATRLGEEMGRITSETLLVDLYLLRGGIDEASRKHWRLGKDATITPKIRAARDEEVKRWLVAGGTKGK